MTKLNADALALVAEYEEQTARSTDEARAYYDAIIAGTRAAPHPRLPRRALSEMSESTTDADRRDMVMRLFGVWGF